MILTGLMAQSVLTMTRLVLLTSPVNVSQAVVMVVMMAPTTALPTTALPTTAAVMTALPTTVAVMGKRLNCLAQALVRSWMLALAPAR